MLKKFSLFALVLGWLGALIIGTTISATYENRPGEKSLPPARAAGMRDSKAKLSSNRSGLQLLMFVHPKCPCSRASMYELVDLLEKFPNLKATVFFYRPASEKPGWEKTDIWRTATVVKSITAKIDVDGAKAKAYRVVTSGEVLLYDAEDRLVFSGGITGARGHVGENFGKEVLANIIEEEISTKGKHFTSPVFGCRILPDGTQLCVLKPRARTNQ